MKIALALLVLAAQDKIQWTKDFDAGLKQAKKDGRYVVLHFSGPN